MSDDETLAAQDPATNATAASAEDAGGIGGDPANEAAATQLQPVEQTGAEASAPDETEALRRKCADLSNQVLRRRADFENYRKRVERERALVATDAEAILLKQLLPTIDNMERALDSAAKDDPLREGLALIHRELLALLSRLGVVEHSPADQPFDPETDEALVHDPAPGVPEGHVVEVLRKGYLYRERLLRPAWVKVAKGEPKAETTPDSDDETLH